MDPSLDRQNALGVLEPADRAFVASLQILRRVEHSSAACARQMQYTRHTICGSLRELRRHRAGSGAGKA